MALTGPQEGANQTFQSTTGQTFHSQAVKKSVTHLVIEQGTTVSKASILDLFKPPLVLVY